MAHRQSSHEKATDMYDQFLVDIVRYFYHFEIPEDDAAPWDRARLALLDALGCAVESLTESEECRSMVGHIVPGSQVPNGVHLVGTGYVLDPIKASFDLGTMIRYLDHNDAYSGQEWGHPSDTLGAILSIADWQTRTHASSGEGRRISMRTILEALIKTYEVHCLFQHSNCLNKRGYDHTILVKVASAVSVSWLLGMHEAQALAALSQAYMDGGLLRAYRHPPNTGPRKGWAAGDACMRAAHLALLVRSGQPGAPTVLSDPKWGFSAVLMDGTPFGLPFPYATYAIRHVFFKLMVAEGHGISACSAALVISKQIRDGGRGSSSDGSDGNDGGGTVDLARIVTKIQIRTMKPAILNIDKQGPLHNRADRDHCLGYMVAVVLLKGDLPTAEDYADESPFASDARVDALRAVTFAREDPQLTADYYDPLKRTAAAGLTVTLSDGTTLPEVLVEAPLGHSDHPDTAAGVMVKFRRNMAKAGYQSRDVDRAIEATEQPSLPVSDFMDLFWKGHTSGKL